MVRVVDDLPEATPRHIAPGIKLDDLGGDRVILDLGNGVYAFYAHLKAGGVRLPGQGHDVLTRLLRARSGPQARTEGVKRPALNAVRSP